ncbi:hypothetical protein DY000_02013644 [Brassica cretica]|uniref:RNase H type-1 domain-containing protein n=1 Tax=Brassica cretica TaxID=69181 RepID=A0ABQ7CYG6_BRACR|nr:hypothetical protein DY000_02013644 [Brassica cretica]
MAIDKARVGTDTQPPIDTMKGEGKRISLIDYPNRAGAEGTNLASAREWLNAQEPAVHVPHRSKIKERPAENCHKLRSDAAWREDSRIAGLGWTIQKNSEISKYCAHCHFVTSPLVAEALALREAISKCKELGIQRLLCETDSTQLVNIITSRKPSPPIYGIVIDIISLFSEFELIHIRWIHRENNKVTDIMNSTPRGF